MSRRLKDKVAIVTGAAHGMGEQIARLFAAEGAKVVIADLLEDRGKAVAGEIVARGEAAIFVRADVTLESDWQRLVEQAVERFGRLDILVNNAGISASAFADNDSVDAWDKMLSINARSVFLGTLATIPELKKSGKGSIVNISSIMGIVGGEHNHPAYHASKGAVRIYSKAAACRYGPHNIRVNSVHPGIMPPMLSARNSHPEPGGREKVIQETPLKRTGEAREVAYGVLYLASDEASFVTGAELVIDGGLTAR